MSGQQGEQEEEQQQMNPEEDVPYSERSSLYVKISPGLDDLIRESGNEVFGRKRGYLLSTVREALLVWMATVPYRERLLEMNPGESIQEIVGEILRQSLETSER